MTILQNPCFKAGLLVKKLSNDRFIVFEESKKYTLLEGEVYSQLIPCLYPNSSSTEDIVDKLEGELSAAEIYYALIRLTENGFIEEKTALSGEIAHLAQQVGISSQEAEKRMQTTPICIHNLGCQDLSSIEKQLSAVSVQFDKKANNHVVFADTYHEDSLQALAEKLEKEQKNWLLIKSAGNELWIGPIFIPGKTACFECLSFRMKMNQAENLWLEKNGSIDAPIGSTPFFFSFLHAFSVREILTWILQKENHSLEGKIVSFDLFSKETKNHLLVKRPQCPSCGNPQRNVSPITFAKTKTDLYVEGGFRTVPTEITYERFKHHISPITGVVQNIKRKKSWENLFVYDALHSSPIFSVRDVSNITKMKIACSGKGKTDIQSKVSCLCEGLERYSGNYFGDEYREKKSYVEIEDEAIHPTSLLQFSEKQHANANIHDETAPFYCKSFAKFDERKEIDWSPVWSLTNNRWKWAPTTFCYFNYKNEKGDKEDFCVADSNGCASGNTIEEAILQGLFELVERDAIAIWWYNCLSMPEVSLDLVKDPYVQQMRKTYKDMNRDLWIIDITMDIPIPTFAAISKKIDSNREEIIMGFGSHLDPSVALTRAITEATQCLYFDIFETTTDIYIKNWIEKETVEKNPYLLPNQAMQSGNYFQKSNLSFKTLHEAIKYCQKLLAEKNLELLVLDQTREDIGLSVARVIVPELRHFWTRLAPGRLYDVPIELGLVKEKTKEENVNPLPIFL